MLMINLALVLIGSFLFAKIKDYLIEKNKR